MDTLSSATDDLPPVVLAVNKMDLRETARITEEKVKSTYVEKFAGHFFVSALTGEEIDNLFMFAAQCGYRDAINHQASAESALNDRTKGGNVCTC
jgi:predicted GTPase